MMEHRTPARDNTNIKAASAVDREYAILFFIRKAMRAGVDGSCFLRVLWDLLNEFMLSSVESIQAFAQLGL